MTSTFRRGDLRTTEVVDQPRVVVGDPGSPLGPPDIEKPGVDRRSSDGVARLSRQLNDACTAAVTSHQIAALLEAEGLNDRLVQERYARASVFVLARELYERVPLRRTAEDSLVSQPPSQIHQASTFAMLLRGPLYLAPIIFFLGAGDHLQGTGLMVAGLIALLIAWSWNQGFGALTHRIIGRGDIPGAHRLARRALILGTVVATTVAGGIAALTFGPNPEEFLFAAGQSAYLVGTATLIVFGRDRLLMLALAPGLIIVTTSLIRDDVLPETVMAATIATPILIVCAALIATFNRHRTPRPHLRKHDKELAVANAVLGLIWAVVIGVSALALIGTGSILIQISIAAAGMVLTMGVSEWRLTRLRTRLRLALATTFTSKSFAKAANRFLARSLLIIGIASCIATTGVLMVASYAEVLTPSSVVLAVGFAFLSIAFFAGLLLIVLHNQEFAIAASIGFLVEVGALVMMVQRDSLVLAGIYTLGCFVLSVALVIAAFARIGNPVYLR